MNKAELKEEIIPLANEVFVTSPKEVASENRSEIVNAEFSWRGIKFKVLGQNLKKIDRRTKSLTKFAKLAQDHEVYWLIDDSTNEWYLVVDGVWVSKKGVDDEGKLLAESAL